VGAESAKEAFIKKGVPDNKITVTGIPTDQVFTQEFDVDALKAKHEVSKDKKTVFLLSGGFGVGPLEKILYALNNCKSEIQVIVVCGHNEKLYERIDNTRNDFKYPIILFGFTDKVAELMAISDLIVTKAGGISTTEALNSRLPMVLFASVPGQETWNEKMLVKNNAAIKASKAVEISNIVDRILISQDVRESMIEGINKTRRPNAAENIVNILINKAG